MKTILVLMTAGALSATLAFAQSERGMTADTATPVGADPRLRPDPAAATPFYGRGGPRYETLGRDRASSSSGRNLLVYVITGDLQFGIVDLASGAFMRIGSAPLMDAEAGLTPGPGTSLLTIGSSGNLDAIDPRTGHISTVGPTGLHDCSMGSSGPNCPNVMGRLDGSFYATDFANNLYSVNPKTGAARLIGPTGIPPVTFVPFSENPDGSVNVYTENLFSAHGKLYANFATVAVNFATGTFEAMIPGAVYQIDPKSGRATWIAPTDDNLTGVVNVNDTIYAFDVASGKVVTLDVTSGKTTPISDLDRDAGVIVGATPARPYRREDD